MQYRTGQKVVVKQTADGVRNSYPAANWLINPTTVTLLEDCLSGTLDVVNVQLEDGTKESVYSFNIDRIKA